MFTADSPSSTTPLSTPASRLAGTDAAEDASVAQGRLHSLVNSMADGVLAVDEKACVVLYNGAALNTLDVNADIKGKNLNRIMTLVDNSDKVIDVSEMVLASKHATTNRDLRLKYPDNSLINLYLSIAPVHLGYGVDGEQGFVVLIRDITHEKSLEEERNEFISVVSHELRTPITIAEGNISNAQLTVEKNGDLSKIKDALKQAHDQVLFLADMINDLSTLSRAERGKLQVDREAINVHELLSDLQKNYLPDATRKNLQLLVEVDPSLEILYSGKLYVREILQNYITNAIKYTEAGSVTVSARPEDDGVLFEVSDTGIGIGKGDQEKIFQKFFRADNGQTRAQTGTGLGLYVTQKLAKMLNAQITLLSEIDQGSTFKITIPNLPETTANSKDSQAE